MPAISPFSAGLRGRCPKCGDGRLFSSYLKIAPECETCGQSFGSEDVGDGAAVFIMLIVGSLIVPSALFMELVAKPSIWLHMIVWLPLSVVLVGFLLPVSKGVLFALQWRHSAGLGSVDEGND